jgi:hypothetical protein
MDKLNFQHLLRYALPGAVYLVARVALTTDNPFAIFKNIDIGTGTVAIGLTLPIGALIYGLHRSVFYPRILRHVLLGSGFDGDVRNATQAPQDLPIDLAWMLLLWRARPNMPELQNMDEWNARVHFLLCAAAAIMFALLTALPELIMTWDCRFIYRPILALGAITLLLRIGFQDVWDSVRTEICILQGRARKRG